MVFGPDRRNRIYLQANLLINGIADVDEIYPVALGTGPRRQVPFTPGPAHDIGLSQISSSQGADGYAVEVVAFDDLVDLTNKILAIKIDAERYEHEVLDGMQGRSVRTAASCKSKCSRSAMRRFAR